MDPSPGEEGEGERIAGWELLGLLALLDESDESSEGTLSGFFGIGTLLFGGRRFEHNSEVLGTAEGEGDIGEASLAEAASRRDDRSGGRGHSRGELVVTLDGDRGKKVVFVVEVTVRGVVGDTGTTGDLAEGEGGGTNLGDKADGRVEQGLAQIAVMVGFRAFRLCHVWVDSIALAWTAATL